MTQQLTSKAPCGVSTKALDHGVQEIAVHMTSWGYIKFVDGNPLDSAFNADPQQVSSKAMGSGIWKDAMREGL